MRPVQNRSMDLLCQDCGNLQVSVQSLEYQQEIDQQQRNEPLRLSQLRDLIDSQQQPVVSTTQLTEEWSLREELVRQFACMELCSSLQDRVETLEAAALHSPRGDATGPRQSPPGSSPSGEHRTQSSFYVFFWN